MATTTCLNNGLQYARNEQYYEAIQEFTALLAHDQTQVDALFYRGCAHLRLRKYQNAIDDFDSAIALHSLSIEHEIAAFYKRGHAYFQLKQFNAARNDYNCYVSQCQLHPESNHLLHKGYFQLGSIYAASNQLDLASKYFTDAIQASAETDEEDKQKLYYLHRGRAYACCAKYENARVDLNLTVAQSNDLFIKGCAYNELGRHDDARQAFDDLLKSTEDQSKFVRTYQEQIFFRRGLSYASLHLHDEALRDFQYALEQTTQHGSADMNDRILFRRGMSHMALNDPYRALTDLNQSTELNASQPDVYYARSMLQYSLGRYNAAVRDQQKALELERKHSPSTVPQHLNNCQQRVHDAEEALKKSRGTVREADCHRLLAGCLQKQAEYTNDPLASYKLACEHINACRQPSSELQTVDSVKLAFNYFCLAHYLAENHANGYAPEFAIAEYIKYQTGSILEMSQLFDQCTTEQDWRTLSAILYDAYQQCSVECRSEYDKICHEFLKTQLFKCKMIRTTRNSFSSSQEQQEFYVRLVIRLCDLFDGVRAANARLVSHSFESSITKVSWIFKVFEILFGYAPVSSKYGKALYGLCERGRQKFDETRIENALKHLGSFGDRAKFCEIANKIARELTTMYENQIKRFPTTAQEQVSVDDRPSRRRKARLLKASKCSTMKTIVDQAVGLFLNCLITIEVENIKNDDDIQNAFINGVCRATSYQMMALEEMIKPKDARNENEKWDTCDFFRRPAIVFENGTIRAMKATDLAKFGWRKPSTEEKAKPEELNAYGFEITLKKDVTL